MFNDNDEFANVKSSSLSVLRQLKGKSAQLAELGGSLREQCQELLNKDLSVVPPEQMESIYRQNLETTIQLMTSFDVVHDLIENFSDAMLKTWSVIDGLE